MQILDSSPVSPHLQIHQLLQKAFGKTHFEIHLELKEINELQRKKNTKTLND